MVVHLKFHIISAIEVHRDGDDNQFVGMTYQVTFQYVPLSQCLRLSMCHTYINLCHSAIALLWILDYCECRPPLINNLLAKYKSTIMDGPKVQFQETVFLWNLFNDSYVLPIMQQSIRQNCFYAHPKNVLLTVLGDENKVI